MKIPFLLRFFLLTTALVALLARPGGAVEPEWQPLFDGKTLAGWKETKFAGGGEVSVKAGELRLAMGAELSGVNFTGAMPKVGYELALEAQRVEGGDFFCGLTFPYGDDFCTLIVGGWGGATVGLSSIDGNDASENETTKSMKFEKGRWYKIRVRVTAAKIEAWIDDEQMVNVETKDKKIGLRTGDIELSKPCGIATFQTTGALRAIRLRALGAAGPAAAAERIYAPQDLDSLRAVLGQTVRIEGTIVKQGESKDAKVRYLNFSENYKESLGLVFMVAKGDGEFSKEKLTNFVGKKVRVTGAVGDYKGQLQIEVRALDQLRLVP